MCCCHSQASLITEYAAVVQPIQLAFQQQIQALKTQHEEFVTSLKQPQPTPLTQPPTSEPEKPLPMTTQAGKNKCLYYIKYCTSKGIHQSIFYHHLCCTQGHGASAVKEIQD